MSAPSDPASPFRDSLTVGLVQITATTEIARNVALAEPLIRDAAAKGAELVLLPEVANLMQVRKSEAKHEVRTEADDPFLARSRDLAEELSIWIHVGSLVIKLEDDERQANRGYLIDPGGHVRAVYDKIHMFDVDLAGGESYRESRAFRPGERAVLAQTPWGGYGMTICYDVRFPHLYRDLAKAGARVLAVPAAFTRQTGEAHWHALLRARAIENGCFVIATGQTGDHEDGRKTYGHALVYDPWGELLVDAGTDTGVTIATLDLTRVAEVRGMVPSLGNDRAFAPAKPLGLAEVGE